MKQALMRNSSAIAFSLMVAGWAFSPGHAHAQTSTSQQKYSVAYVSEDGQTLYANGQQYTRDDDGKPGALYYSSNGDGRTLRINDNGIAVGSDGLRFDIARRPDPRPLPPSNMPTPIKPPVVSLPPSNMPTPIKPIPSPLPPSNMPTPIKPPVVSLPPSNMPTPAMPPLTIDEEGTISHNPLPPTSLPPKLPPIIDDGGVVFTPKTSTPAPAHYGKPDWNPNTRQREWDSLSDAQKADWTSKHPAPGTKESLPKPIVKKPIEQLPPVGTNGYTIDRKGVVTDSNGHYAFTYNARSGKFYDGKAVITDPNVIARFKQVAATATKVKNAPKPAKKESRFNSDGSIFYDAKGTPYYKDGDTYYDHSDAKNNLTVKNGQLVDNKGKVYGQLPPVKQTLTPVAKKLKEPVIITIPSDGATKKLAHGYSIDSKGVIKNPNGGTVGLIDKKGGLVDDKGKPLPTSSQTKLVALFSNNPTPVSAAGGDEPGTVASQSTGTQVEEKLAAQRNAYVAATDTGEIKYPGRDSSYIYTAEAERKKALDQKQAPIVKAPPSSGGLQLPPPGYVRRTAIGLTMDEKGTIRGTAGQVLGYYHNGHFMEVTGAPASDQQSKEWHNAFSEAYAAPADTIPGLHQPVNPTVPPTRAPDHFGRPDWNPNTRQLEWNSLTNDQKTDWLKKNPVPAKPIAASTPGISYTDPNAVNPITVGFGPGMTRPNGGAAGTMFFGAGFYRDVAIAMGGASSDPWNAQMLEWERQYNALDKNNLQAIEAWRQGIADVLSGKTTSSFKPLNADGRTPYDGPPNRKFIQTKPPADWVRLLEEQQAAANVPAANTPAPVLRPGSPECGLYSQIGQKGSLCNP